MCGICGEIRFDNAQGSAAAVTVMCETLEPAARRRELFRRDYVDNPLANPETTLTPKRYSKLWQVALLEFWLKTHGL